MTKPLQSTVHHQKDAFLHGEANHWLERNSDSAISAPKLEMLQQIRQFLAPGNRVLEIGCSDGRNLASLHHWLNSLTCHGVDPSTSAAAAAKARFPGISVDVGTADELRFDHASFDVVYFGFCLYLVDRPLLLQSLAEADRVLRDKGFLIITDFDPPSPMQRPYRHLNGVYSYKMQYANIYLASGHYQMASKHSYSHAAAAFHADPAERISTVVLQKDIYAGYQSEADIVR